MAVSSNQSAIINSNGFVTLPSGMHWYPFDHVQCPPSYYVILQGVCAPLIIIISTILNSLIAVVLLQRHLRSPTNILLLAIALYDTLTGLFPFPAYIFVFTFRKCDDYIPFNYGWFHRINHDILPFIFHTCSIWVTVVLAIQRYVYVCYSEKSKKWCTVSMTLKAIACVNVLALIVAIPMFLEGTFHSTPVVSKNSSKETFNACAVRDYSVDPRWRTSFSVYSVLRALLINVGPCTILVIFNAILVARMKEAKQNREKLIRRRGQESRAQEQTNVTLMLVIVVTIFLIVEIPMALYLIITALLRLFGSNLLESLFFAISGQLLNFAVLLSYPINFFIYCRMSRAFRDAFTKLLCPALNETQNQQPPPVAQTPPLTKHYGTATNENDNNHLELNNNNNNIELKSPNIDAQLQSSSVISLDTTAESAVPLASSSPIVTSENNTKKSSVGSLGKHRVAFRDDANVSSRAKFTDL